MDLSVILRLILLYRNTKGISVSEATGLRMLIGESTKRPLVLLLVNRLTSKHSARRVSVSILSETA